MRLIKQSLVGFSLLGLLAGPLSVSAISYGDNQKETSNLPMMQGNFCTRMANSSFEINSKLTKAEDNRGSVRLDILAKLKQRKDVRAQEIQTKRDEAKTNFEKLITNLQAKATTDAEKTAVDVFKTSVANALTTRKTAVDAAVNTYQDALDALIGNREDVIKTAAATFKSAVTSAIATAKADCTAGTDPATVRTTFMASLKSANEAFRSAVQVKVQGQNNQQIEALAKTRNDAIKAANNAFKQSLKQARDTLKTAFPSA